MNFDLNRLLFMDALGDERKMNQDECSSCPRHIASPHYTVFSWSRQEGNLKHLLCQYLYSLTFYFRLSASETIKDKENEGDKMLGDIVSYNTYLLLNNIILCAFSWRRLATE